MTLRGLSGFSSNTTLSAMNIGLDFDGVIADCGALKQEGARKLYNIHIAQDKFKKEIVVGKKILTAEQYRELQRKIYDTREYGLQMKIVRDAKEYIDLLISDGHVVSIITSRSDNGLEVAQEWAKNNSINLPFVGCGNGVSKSEACKKFALDIFIDDDLDKLSDLESVSNLFLFSWPYNESEQLPSHVQRVFSWYDFYNKIKKLS